MEAIKIVGTKLDRRVKLGQKEREEIKKLRGAGYTQQKLADMFGVSRRTIGFITDPSYKEVWNATFKRRGGSKRYYNKAYNTKRIREYRHYKKFVAAAVDQQGWSVLKINDSEALIKKFRRQYK